MHMIWVRIPLRGECTFFPLLLVGKPFNLLSVPSEPPRMTFDKCVSPPDSSHVMILSGLIESFRIMEAVRRLHSSQARVSRGPSYCL